MRIRNFAKAASSLFSQHMLGGYKRVSVSYISIFLVLVLIITTTISWFTFQSTASIDSTEFTMKASSGLRVNDGEDLENHIRLDQFLLAEASSVDGRNMYFPSEGNFTDNTGEMTFREGNAGDKNVLYAHENFSLQGDSQTTYVYVKSYSVSVDRKTEDGSVVTEVFDGATKLTYKKNDDGTTSRIPIAQEFHAECPVRISLIGDSSKEPNVFDPRALVDRYVINYDAVSAADTSGKALTNTTSAKSFSEYYYGTGVPLFILQGSKSVTASMVVWLEGTSSVVEQYAGQRVTVDIELESNWTNMHYVEFVDDTIGDGGEQQHWVDEDPNREILIVMTYRDVDASTSEKDVWKSVVMTPDSQNSTLSNKKWYAYLPDNVKTDISFYRYNAENEIIYNSWHTRIDVKEMMESTAKGWYEDIFGRYGKQDYRTSDGTATGSLLYTYTARRGNGYYEVPGGDLDPEAQRQRLSPCVGYWGTPINQDTEPTTADPEGTTSPTTPTQAPTQATGEELTIDTVELGSIRTDTGADVYNYLNSGYELYLDFTNADRIEIRKHDNNTYRSSGVKIKKNSILKQFIVSNGTNEYSIPLSCGQWPVVNNDNLIFYMEDGIAKKN